VYNISCRCVAQLIEPKTVFLEMNYKALDVGLLLGPLYQWQTIYLIFNRKKYA